mmetsp:Transcript_33054/g.77118  ORF Transcript_33054/g.77118 Transcript_33054/m.77118 type:complete len:235 (-) Transcript_33054:148-852(-)
MYSARTLGSTSLSQSERSRSKTASWRPSWSSSESSGCDSCGAAETGAGVCTRTEAGLGSTSTAFLDFAGIGSADAFLFFAGKLGSAVATFFAFAAGGTTAIVFLTFFGDAALGLLFTFGAGGGGTTAGAIIGEGLRDGLLLLLSVADDSESSVAAASTRGAGFRRLISGDRALGASCAGACSSTRSVLKRSGRCECPSHSRIRPAVPPGIGDGFGLADFARRLFSFSAAFSAAA